MIDENQILGKKLVTQNQMNSTNSEGVWSGKAYIAFPGLLFCLGFVFGYKVMTRNVLCTSKVNSKLIHRLKEGSILSSKALAIASGINLALFSPAFLAIFIFKRKDQ